jgi:hypothetical protein
LDGVALRQEARSEEEKEHARQQRNREMGGKRPPPQRGGASPIATPARMGGEGGPFRSRLGSVRRHHHHRREDLLLSFPLNRCGAAKKTNHGRPPRLLCSALLFRSFGSIKSAPAEEVSQVQSIDRPTVSLGQPVDDDESRGGQIRAASRSTRRRQMKVPTPIDFATVHCKVLGQRRSK